MADPAPPHPGAIRRDPRHRCAVCLPQAGMGRRRLMPEEDDRTAADDRARRLRMAWLRRGQDRAPLMDRYLPTYDIRMSQDTLVRATPADIYAAVQRLDALISDDPLVRALSAMRLAPMRLARLLRRSAAPATAPAAAAAA